MKDSKNPLRCSTFPVARKSISSKIIGNLDMRSRKGLSALQQAMHIILQSAYISI
jgi:hypothetical protein